MRFLYIILVLLLFSGTCAPVTGDPFVPVPTRPMYYHEYLCPPMLGNNSPVVLVFRDTENFAADSVWNVSVGSPFFVHEVSRVDNEYEADRTLHIERFTPEKGYEYLVIPVRIQNTGPVERCIDISRFSLSDNKTGETFPVDEVMDFLCNPFRGGTIESGEETAGTITYQVFVGDDFDFSILLEDIRVTYCLKAPKLALSSEKY